MALNAIRIALEVRNAEIVCYLLSLRLAMKREERFAVRCSFPGLNFGRVTFLTTLDAKHIVWCYRKIPLSVARIRFVGWRTSHPHRNRYNQYTNKNETISFDGGSIDGGSVQCGFTHVKDSHEV